MSMVLKSWLGTRGHGRSHEGIRITSEDSARMKNYLLGNEGDDKFYVNSQLGDLAIVKQFKVEYTESQNLKIFTKSIRSKFVHSTSVQ